MENPYCSSKADTCSVALQDVWLEKGGTGDPGFTYNAKENPMLLGYMKDRFDRALLLSVGQQAAGGSSP